MSTVSQLLKTSHRHANLFGDQLLPRNDSAKDTLESCNELTVVNNADSGVTGGRDVSVPSCGSSFVV